MLRFSSNPAPTCIQLSQSLRAELLHTSIKCLPGRAGEVSFLFLAICLILVTGNKQYREHSDWGGRGQDRQSSQLWWEHVPGGGGRSIAHREMHFIIVSEEGKRKGTVDWTSHTSNQIKKLPVRRARRRTAQELNKRELRNAKSDLPALFCRVPPGSSPGVRVRGPEKPQQEDWLHNLQGSVQNENVGFLGSKHDEEFQDSDSRAWNQAHALLPGRFCDTAQVPYPRSPLYLGTFLSGSPNGVSLFYLTNQDDRARISLALFHSKFCFMNENFYFIWYIYSIYYIKTMQLYYPNSKWRESMAVFCRCMWMAKHLTFEALFLVSVSCPSPVWFWLKLCRMEKKRWRRQFPVFSFSQPHTAQHVLILGSSPSCPPSQIFPWAL